MILTICAVGFEHDYMTRFRGEFGAVMFLAYAKICDINGYDMNLDMNYCTDMGFVSTIFYL